ncbi:MAG TPA: hypothetical protein PKI14_03235 [Fervidobacterium sp.]|nr:hypothetical protein [Fervidobacterium sp.]
MNSNIKFSPGDLVEVFYENQWIPATVHAIGHKSGAIYVASPMFPGVRNFPPSSVRYPDKTNSKCKVMLEPEGVLDNQDIVVEND